jgi:hypothetical protein
MTTFHGDLGRQPHGSAMEYHDRALKEVECAFAGWAEQVVVAALEQAIRSSGLEPAATGVRDRARSISAASETIEDREGGGFQA